MQVIAQMRRHTSGFLPGIQISVTHKVVNQGSLIAEVVNGLANHFLKTQNTNANVGFLNAFNFHHTMYSVIFVI